MELGSAMSLDCCLSNIKYKLAGTVFGKLQGFEDLE